MALAAPTQANTPRTASEDTQTIQQEFQEMCRTLKGGSLPYYGEQRAEELRAELERLEDPLARVRVQGELGQQLLQLNHIDEAIEVLTKALGNARELFADQQTKALLLSSLILAHLQAAEDDNCLMHGTAATCLLPISKDGVHRRVEHTRKAGDLSLELDTLSPRKYEIAWILNLARMLSADYPQGVPASLRLPADAFASQGAIQPWRDRALDVGLKRVELAGGALMDDFDGDGLLDLVTSTWDPCGSLHAYRNDGRGRFEEVTNDWGLDSQLGGLNLTHADFDNDGDLDILVLRGGWLFSQGRIRNSLLRNDLVSDGGFIDVSREAGVAEPAYPTQTAAWADYDGDGDLDLYIGNEHSGQAAYPSQLLRNNGDGSFTDVTWIAGVSNMRLAKGVGWGDIDNDGDPDLFVSNNGANRLYINLGNGRFQDEAVERGVEKPLGWSFVPWFFDYDNDGDLDLFVGDFTSPMEEVAASYFGVEFDHGYPVVYRNDRGRFTDVSRELGLTRPQMPMGANYGDIDNDGWLDIYLGTGDPSFQSQVPNIMYRNQEGRGFLDVTFAGGFGHLQKGHAIAFGDVDNDGDQDILHQLGGFYPSDGFRNALFENPGGGHWITLRLEGRKANRFGVGARIEIKVGEGEKSRSIHVVAGPGGSFGGSSLQQEIGLGGASSILEIVVLWPGSALTQRFADVVVDRVYRVVEGKEELLEVKLPLIRLGGE